MNSGPAPPITTTFTTVVDQVDAVEVGPDVAAVQQLHRRTGAVIAQVGGGDRGGREDLGGVDRHAGLDEQPRDVGAGA